VSGWPGDRFFVEHTRVESEVAVLVDNPRHVSRLPRQDKAQRKLRVDEFFFACGKFGDSVLHMQLEARSVFADTACFALAVFVTVTDDILDVFLVEALGLFLNVSTIFKERIEIDAGRYGL